MEIKKIILDKKLNVYDKLILIYKEIDKDLEPLSKALDIPVELLDDYKPVGEPKKKTNVEIKNGLKTFFDIYMRFYEKLYDRKPHHSKKEGVHMNNIYKRINDPKEWEVILSLIFKMVQQFEDGVVFRKWTWKVICDDVRPSIIFSKLNFILNELSLLKRKPKTKWEGFEDENNKK